jgi:catalase
VVTHEEAMERIHARYGAHPGHRALHAKGAIYKATFTATPSAAKLTRAGHMAGAPVQATVRFSNGGGNPTEPDYAPDVRGLAVAFHLPDGSRTDILSQTIPYFTFPDQEGFFEALEISKRDLRALLKLPWFALRHPKAMRKLPEVNKILATHRSFAAHTYFPFHAYKWVDAGGGERFIRYRWLATVDEQPISKEEARERGRDWLFEEMADRLARAPVRMELEVQIAAGDDNPDDPSDEWPADRERVVVGTLEVTGIDANADDGIVFDPMRLVDGIEPSGDPVLHYRPPVYSLSHAARTGD